MSIYLIVTKHDMIEVASLLEQQKKQRANENNNQTLKQTLIVQLAGIFEPITETIAEVNESTKK